MRWEARDDAPQTFEDVARCWAERRTIVVWTGASEKTIWGAPEANWRFRAEHDAAHLATGLGFDHASEIELAYWQAGRVEGDWLKRAVLIEVAEGARYHRETGLFVADQIEFARLHGLEV